MIFLARSEITNRGVQYILDTVVQALLDNPDRRYIYVEMAFFWRWWNQQSDEMRDTVKQLVNEGSLYGLISIILYPNRYRSSGIYLRWLVYE